MFSALRSYAILMKVIGWVSIVGGTLVTLILYASQKPLAWFGVPFIVIFFVSGFGLLVSGQYLELQLAIHDQLAEHTRLLKRLVNLNLPGKDE